MGGCRDGGVETFLLCRESLEYNASLKDLLVRGSKNARS